jgi:hypothetical protein
LAGIVFDIDAGAFVPRETRRMPSIGSPRQHYLAADRRELGVAVRSVSFRIVQ